MYEFITQRTMTSRTYNSALRAAQAEATRNRILEAVVEVLAEGVETLSIPAVAERAEVSVGTVYRHFGDKKGLLDGLVSYAGESSGIEIDRTPETLDQFDQVIRQVFRHFEATDDLLRAAFASRIGREARLQSSSRRLSYIEDLFRRVEPNLTPDQVTHVAKTTLILTASDTFREWKERLGLTPDEAAEEVTWTIRTLLEGLKT